MATLNMTLVELLEVLGEGKLLGEPEFRCRELLGLEEAGPRDLSFVKGRKQMEAGRASRAGALLVPEPIDGTIANQIVLAEPFVALTRVLARLAADRRFQPAGIHESAHVADGATIGADVYLGPNVVVGNGTALGDGTVVHANAFIGPRCVLGRECVVHPNVVLREDVTLGDRVVVRSGSVIGSEGYGFLPTDGRPVDIPQVGGVVIGDDVEIGALATIDCATFGRTEVGSGSKIGDMVHVGHNCKVGRNVMLLPMVGIAGSVEIGDGALLAGRSSCADNLKIGKGARVGANSVVFKDVGEGEVVWGRPARPKTQEMRIQTLLGRLPELFRDVRRLIDG